MNTRRFGFKTAWISLGEPRKLGPVSDNKKKTDEGTITILNAVWWSCSWAPVIPESKHDKGLAG